MRLRRALHAHGFRYRVQYPVPGARRRTIDIAFTRQRIAIFVDGCFWHGCTEHRGVPASNETWWRNKLANNTKRDADTDARLRGHGWQVIRVWEHEPVEQALARIIGCLETVTAAP
jgi:DNA mismatch endonuclease (patch repair protein)